MEKKSRTGDSVFLKLPRMFLIMKTVFISLVCTLNVQANVFSQHTKFDIAMKNVTVSEVLCYLEEISKYRFVYDSDAIDRMQRVDVEMKGTKLETVLESIFVKSGFSFVIEDGVVIIREAGKKQITAGILPQSRKITGRVRDHGGHPLPGVTVVLKGTSVGVVTDVDGHFKMDLPADHETVLVFSFVGMKTQEVYYKGEKELNVVMEEEVKQMDEVVVTGIFSKSKESYTGAVSVITEKELKSFGNRNILTTLRNIDPSFNILESNEWGSNPNRLPEVQIRGAANMPDIDQLQSDTKAELNTPLIIMDGFEITLERMMDLDDSEVETITLLKDASATAIYGSRGANGVIVITTKEPEPGKLRFAYTGMIGAMSRYSGTKFVLISPEELRLPDYIKKEYIEKKGIAYEESVSLEDSIGKADVLYMTRIQKERFESEEEYERLKDVYILTEEKMRLAKNGAIIMHPLPRVNEISVKVDDDPRACYFEQTRCGRWMRMALILKLLAEKDLPDHRKRNNEYEDSSAVCKNPRCITTVERELTKLVYKDDDGAIRCAYCDERI